MTQPVIVKELYTPTFHLYADIVRIPDVDANVVTTPSDKIHIHKQMFFFGGGGGGGGKSGWVFMDILHFTLHVKRM